MCLFKLDYQCESASTVRGASAVDLLYHGYSVWPDTKSKSQTLLSLDVPEGNQ